MSIISFPKLIKITTLIEKLLFISKPTLEHYVPAEGPGGRRRGIDHELAKRGCISQAKNGVRYSLHSAGGRELNDVGIGRREAFCGLPV